MLRQTDGQKQRISVADGQTYITLAAHGIDGELLRWIVNWLSDRRQRVVLMDNVPLGEMY